MFYAADLIKTYRTENPDWKDKPFVLVPKLAVEVVSKNDSYSDITRKVELYLQDGVQVVWVIDPKREQVTVYAPDTPTQFLSGGNTLSGGEIIPDFEISVAELFE